MKEIVLQTVFPEMFGGETGNSEIWHKEVTLRTGEKYLIEAVSGAGKSSLCAFLYGYRQDYRGEILFDGKNIRYWNEKEWSKARNTALSILFQDLRLFQDLTARENIEIKNRLTGFRSDTWIEEVFERLGIAAKQNEPVATLSFGQRQRVALVRALCQPFSFILLDEPVSHLDDCNNREMGKLVEEEANRLQAGVIVTSIGKKLEMKYDKILHL